MREKRISICCVLSFLTLLIYAQDFKITPLEPVKEFNGGEFMARIDLISSSATLDITENNGETIQKPVQRADGKYVYTCLCNVRDTNKFGFQIVPYGGVETQRLSVYIEEGELKEYRIDVVDNSIAVQISEIPSVVIPIESTSRVRVTSANDDLVITSATGEEMEGPTKNALGTYEYVFMFDLSAPESRTLSRSLNISADGKRFTPYPLTGVSPKNGIELAVVVVNINTCAIRLNAAENYFLNGSYKEAANAYGEMMASEECSNEFDENELQKKQKTANALDKASILIRLNQANALRCDAEEKYDSCIYYYNEIGKLCRTVLKYNSSDSYSLEHLRKAENYLKTGPRIVYGKVLDNLRMDANGENLPFAGAYIILQKYKKKIGKDKNGVRRTEVGKEIGEPRVIGRTDENGDYSVAVPRNDDKVLYVLYYSPESDSEMNAVEYIPEEKDRMNAIVKISPKKGVKYNNKLK